MANVIDFPTFTSRKPVRRGDDSRYPSALVRKIAALEQELPGAVATVEKLVDRILGISRD
jgi:hypothetical protein